MIKQVEVIMNQAVIAEIYQGLQAQAYEFLDYNDLLSAWGEVILFMRVTMNQTVIETMCESLKEYHVVSGDYDTLISAWGKVLEFDKIGDYQGTWYGLVRRDDGTLGVVSGSYGSCSGCDSLQACDSEEELLRLIRSHEPDWDPQAILTQSHFDGYGDWDEKLKVLRTFLLHLRPASEHPLIQAIEDYGTLGIYCDSLDDQGLDCSGLRALLLSYENRGW